MSSPEALHVVCPHCHTTNRVQAAQLGSAPDCGSCHRPLFTGEPLALDAASFDRHVARSHLPVVVDFWAPWCGPCRAMAPMFARAAEALEPRVQLLKLNSDEAPEISAKFGISGIPTLLLLQKGRELARISGAMDSQRIVAWTLSGLRQ